MKKVLIISLIIILFVACGLFGYLYYSTNKDLNDIKKELTNTKNELKEVKEELANKETETKTESKEENKNESTVESKKDCKQELIGSTYTASEEKGLSLRFDSETQVGMISGTSAAPYEYSLDNNKITIYKESTPTKTGEIAEDCNTIKLTGSTGIEEVYTKNN